ncbi:Hypothetical protein PAS_chr2-1_0007 [Komagataella phaffii GS115]|uniref:Uncharacterized protein n=1 Tax=Komagataella phaffii (strain GS115 / ATCC 20864) TaxID=644223 RepID=C4QZD2_KOMPG|nr:Hypothetical protein PAS_chr2-1_0007 [Komagataella phaffii GS115]CAY68606.1 Hypothetical protein PAS_chr2-1_0007 [Komagataella phaffii GS115]
MSAMNSDMPSMKKTDMSSVKKSDMSAMNSDMPSMKKSDMSAMNSDMPSIKKSDMSAMNSVTIGDDLKKSESWSAWTLARSAKAESLKLMRKNLK